MVNSYIESKSQMKRSYTASHELFHILYMKYILKNDYSKRIAWYDEKMAQFLSGEKDYLLDELRFNKYFYDVKNSTLLIPTINDIDHGNSFCNDNYDGYDLSYLAIRYLSETMEKKEFRELLFDFSKIKTIGENILNNMFEYYEKNK